MSCSYQKVNSAPNNKGFTLIEVAVALAILGWVLGSAIFLVNQYSNDRFRMRENFLTNKVAWNQLMQEYQSSRRIGPARRASAEQKGIVLQGHQQWRWEMEIERALGQDLYRYQVNVAAVENGEEELSPSLSIFLVNTRAAQ